MPPKGRPRELEKAVPALKKHSRRDSAGEAVYDVAIIGAGLAGLTLALQLKRARPAISILLLEKGQFPREEAAFKVGESTSEVAGFYLREMLGLKQHLEQEQLVKFGLRFFFTYEGNQDISRRVEAGRSQPSPIATYQLDRGRLENFLQQRALSLGCAVMEEYKVTGVELNQEAHRLWFTQEGIESSVLARWVVDASGRGGVLKRKLDLKAPVEHEVSAAWFRLSRMVDLEEWSQDSQWKARVPGGKRWLSTNHLVGKGYWVWLIPLASGSISIGIVADNRVHPFETFNRFDRAMLWLEKYEPQCYLKLSELEGQLQDFKVQRNFALNSSQVFSAQRWAITGEAGRFLDPLYSMGSDFIAVANTFITNLIYYDFSGEEGESAVAAYDQIHASFFQFFLQIYQNQYPLFGNAQVMLAKLVWDNALYWGFFTLLFFNRKLADLLFMGSISDEVARLRLLQDRMQALFQDWNCLETIEPHGILVDYLQLPLLKEFNAALTTKLSPAEFRQRLSSNIARLEELAVAFFYRAAHGLEGVAPGRPVNPLAISLNRENWEKDGLFTREPLVTPSPDFLKELELIWLKEAPA